MTEFRFPPIGAERLASDLLSKPLASRTPKDFGPRNECPKILPESNTRTNNRFLFLREIGGGDCLHDFFQTLIEDPNSEFSQRHAGGTIIIDQTVEFDKPLMIPGNYTLAGTGMQGGGRLKFTSAIQTDPAITFQATLGHSVIRDLPIIGPGGNSIGIATPFLNHISLHRVRVANFGEIGLHIRVDSTSGLVDNCQFEHNGSHVRLMLRANSWRFRDTIFHDAFRGFAIRLMQPLNDLLISGCRIADSKDGGIWIQTSIDGVFVFGNRFENNAGIAVKIDQGARGVRILSNYFVGNEDLSPKAQTIALDPEEMNTHIGFNFVEPKPNIPVNSALMTIKAAKP